MSPFWAARTHHRPSTLAAPVATKALAPYIISDLLPSEDNSLWSTPPAPTTIRRGRAAGEVGQRELSLLLLLRDLFRVCIISAAAESNSAVQINSVTRKDVLRKLLPGCRRPSVTAAITNCM